MKWQTFETLPMDGTEFLAYSDATNDHGVAYWNETYLVCNNSVGEWFNPTHWQPLTTPGGC